MLAVPIKKKKKKKIIGLTEFILHGLPGAWNPIILQENSLGVRQKRGVFMNLTKTLRYPCQLCSNKKIF